MTCGDMKGSRTIAICGALCTCNDQLATLILRPIPTRPIYSWLTAIVGRRETGLVGKYQTCLIQAVGRLS